MSIPRSQLRRKIAVLYKTCVRVANDGLTLVNRDATFSGLMPANEKGSHSLRVAGQRRHNSPLGSISNYSISGHRSGGADQLSASLWRRAVVGYAPRLRRVRSASTVKYPQ
ncbi:hypothetical protein SBBP2_1290019 [Burkholderiales bacterium]|nr:hypothetical protein SBBP2_1290019 [Burkholderiales bacterium]